MSENMSEKTYLGFHPEYHGRLRPQGTSDSDPERTPHHELLDRSILELEEVRSELSHLLTRIHGGSIPPPQTTNEVRKEPSLHKVLTEGPREIKEIADDMRSIIDQIREALF